MRFLLIVSNCFIPIVMILAGYMMKYHHTEEINDFYGYRTRRSKRNKESWLYAHEVCGRLWMRIGWILCLISIVFSFIFPSDEDLVGIVIMVLIFIQMSVMLGSIYFVEKALKEKFGD